MKQEDKIMVGTIVTKLPLGWINFKTDMYRKKMEIQLENLLHWIYIEDEARGQLMVDSLSKQLARLTWCSLVITKGSRKLPSRTRRRTLTS